jgi:hypothetical protein
MLGALESTEDAGTSAIKASIYSPATTTRSNRGLELSPRLRSSKTVLAILPATCDYKFPFGRGAPLRLCS